MKLQVKIVLFFFIAFLATPTLVSFIDKDVDISSFYNFSEEEENGNDLSFDEIQLISQMSSYFIFSFFNKNTSKFCALQVQIICNYKPSIFIPPPDLT